METTARNRTIGGIVIGAIILILLLVLFSCTVNSDPESSPKKDPTTGESSTPSEQDTIEPEDKPSESESADEESDANDDDIVPAANTGVSFIPAGNVPSGSTPTCELDPSACEGKRPPGAGVDICEIRPDLDQCQPPPTTPPGDGEPTTPPGEDDDNDSPVCDLFPDLPLCDDDGGEDPGEPGEEDETAPEPVTLTDCNVLTNTAAKVDWSKAHDKSGISHYTVSSTPNAGDPGDTGKTSATFNGLDAGRTYTFSVTATDNEGNESEDSNEIDCVMDVTAPEVPTDVTVESVEPTDSALDISWTESEDNEDGVDDVTYNLYRNNTLVGPVNDTEYEDRGLKAGKKYSYRVTAVDGAGNESRRSRPGIGETTKVAPTVPQDVKVSNAGLLGFDVSWKASRDEDGVTPRNEIVYIIEVQGGVLCLPTTTDPGETSRRVGCLLGQDSTVTVTAQDGDGNQSAPSEPASDSNARRMTGDDASLRSNTPGKDKSDAPADKPAPSDDPSESPSEEPTEEKSPLLPPLGDVLGGDKDAEESEESVNPEPSESATPVERPTTEEPAEEKDAPADEEKEDEGGLLGGIVSKMSAAVAAVF